MKAHRSSPLLYGTVFVGVCGAAAVCTALSILLTSPSSEDLRRSSLTPEEAKPEADAILQNKCASCHGPNAGYNSDLNYLSFGLMERHVNGAQRAWLMENDGSIRKDSVNLLKLNNTLTKRNMPPTSYSAIHWGSRLTPSDVAIVRRALNLPADGNVDAITPIMPAPEPTAEQAAKIELGQMLFYDGRLSTNNKISCSSCHDLTKGGTDNKAKSEGVPGPDGKPQLGGVNAPTVYNAANHICQFWDGRARDLQEQAGGPPLNPVEMGYAKPEDWNQIVAKLQQDPDIVARFAAVFGERGMTAETITEAIAAFEQTLVTPFSPFDDYLMGDEGALSEDQKAGWKTFLAHGCATCHSGSAMGGNSFEYINTFADLRSAAAPEDYKEGAFGRYDFTKDEKHRDMFRVPSLRNVALTAPYFHTGSVNKLEDAVRIMFRTQSESKFSEKDVEQVSAFLRCTTGRYKGKSLNELKPEDVTPAKYLGAAAEQQ